MLPRTFYLKVYVENEREKKRAFNCPPATCWQRNTCCPWEWKALWACSSSPHHKAFWWGFFHSHVLEEDQWGCTPVSVVWLLQLRCLEAEQLHGRCNRSPSHLSTCGGLYRCSFAHLWLKQIKKGVVCSKARKLSQDFGKVAALSLFKSVEMVVCLFKLAESFY